ncbi:Rad17 cell cycle checkpoint protein-domain-containing protein [Thelephora terrestris]|uniref:Rad17 cell cycle checkpoint protein-domain-containing protein n=1 Tax=Thelephora terrestris TaxID=56493 RepID=A0A9P6L9B1_9AGAM|nr:Rad17 cell cycle checkpoint protein-domain-containing protein [Thelephora terrestris]
MPESAAKATSSTGGRKASRTSTLTSNCQPPTKKLKSLSFTVPPSFAFDKSPKGIDSSPPQPISQPTPPLVNNKRKGKQKEASDSSLDADGLWVDRYEPLTTEQLVVHSKKVDDVRHWLVEALDGGRLRKYRRILALTGPAGSGKTATIKVLARELGFELMEWKNSTSTPYGGMYPLLDASFTHFIHGTPSDLDIVPQLDKFQEFLNRASTSRSVFGETSSGQTTRQAILLEDLPNIHHADTRDKFHDALRLFVQRQTSRDGEYIPLVVIMSDLGTRGELEDNVGYSSFRGRNEVLGIRTALPADLLSAPYVTQISFNPVAPTLMIKVLQAIADQRFQGSHSPRPTKKVLDMIVTCSRGDVRGAIMELQLSSLASKPTKKGKSNGSNDSVALLKLASQREQSMALFHLIGKVLYNKRKGDPPSSSATKRDREQLRLLEQSIPNPEKLPSHLKLHNRKASLVDVNTLYADSPIDSSLFSLYLHQNYTQYCEKLEECGGIAEWASWIDYSGPEEWFQANPHRFHLLTLGTLHSLPIPVPRRSQKMFKPEFFEQLKRTREASNAAWDVSEWFSREMPQVCGKWNKDDLVCEAGVILNIPSSPRAVHPKPPQSHDLFSRLIFDEGEHLPSRLEEDDPPSQHDFHEDEFANRETEITDEVADGGWLEGDDIEDF